MLTSSPITTTPLNISRKSTKNEPNLRRVTNLLTDQEHLFSDSCNPIAAVAYAYAEEHNLLSQWTFANQENDFSKFPITHGKLSVACGDWATLK